MRLNLETVALLRALDGESQASAVAPALTEAPKQLFEFNFVNRLGSGQLQLTKTGARALFQAECIEALERTVAGTQAAMASGVERWLTSSGFLHAVDKSITPRGKLWLASLTPDASAESAGAGKRAAPAPEDFAARRSASLYT